MIDIKFITPDGITLDVAANEGDSVMMAGVAANVDGIDADCGGACSCATCHVHIQPEFMELLGKPSENEAIMLEFEDGVDEYSRLSCQIKVVPELEAAVFTVEGRS